MLIHLWSSHIHFIFMLVPQPAFTLLSLGQLVPHSPVTHSERSFWERHIHPVFPLWCLLVVFRMKCTRGAGQVFFSPHPLGHPRFWAWARVPLDLGLALVPMCQGHGPSPCLPQLPRYLSRWLSLTLIHIAHPSSVPGPPPSLSYSSELAPQFDSHRNCAADKEGENLSNDHESGCFYCVYTFIYLSNKTWAFSHIISLLNHDFKGFFISQPMNKSWGI